MAFTVEDGTGLPDANAYISVAFFRAHHDDRGRDSSGFADALVEQAIVRATDYIEQRFGRKFRGTKLGKQQGLEWPRLDAYDDDFFLLAGEDDIPRQLEKACAEYSAIALLLGELLGQASNPLVGQDLTDLSSPVAAAPQTGEVKRREQIVGPVQLDEAFVTASERLKEDKTRLPQSTLVSTSLLPQYPRADLWLEELLKSAGKRRLVRGD